MELPESRWRLFMSQKAAKTRYSGVARISETSFRLRGRVRDPKTGKNLDLDRIVEAEGPYEASQQRNQLLADLASHGAPVATERLRLRAFATSWISLKLPSLKRATRALYASVLDSHILPSLGDYYLDSITAE